MSTAILILVVRRCWIPILAWTLHAWLTSEIAAPRSSVSDYDCDFGGYLATSPPASGGHSAAWTAAVVSSTVGSVALLVAALVVVFSCIHLRRRSAELRPKDGLAEETDDPGRTLWLPAPPDWPDNRGDAGGDAGASFSRSSDSRTARLPVLQYLRDASFAQRARFRDRRSLLAKLPQRRHSEGWLVDPDEISVCKRPDGSDHVLGTGSSGKVHVCTALACDVCC